MKKQYTNDPRLNRKHDRHHAVRIFDGLIRNQQAKRAHAKSIGAALMEMSAAIDRSIEKLFRDKP